MYDVIKYIWSLERFAVMAVKAEREIERERDRERGE